MGEWLSIGLQIRLHRFESGPRLQALAKLAKGRYKGARSGLFRGSSVVERSAVNRLVVGSNPTRGAILKPRSGACRNR